METKETIEQKIEGMSKTLKEKIDGIKEKSDTLVDLFRPKASQKHTINGKPVNISLSNKGAIIINFVDIEEAEKYYNNLIK